MAVLSDDRLRLAATALCACGLALSCARSRTSSDEADAGTLRDAPASRDAVAPRDTGADAVPSDGGPDDPGWGHLDLIPDECGVDIAEHPERLWPSVAWAECGAGCRVWSGQEALFTSAWHDGHGLQAVMQFDSRGAAATVVVPLDLDAGRPVAAIRVPFASPDADNAWCGLLGTVLGQGGFALSIRYSDRDAAGDVLERSWTRIVHLSLSDPASAVTIAGQIDDFETSVGALRIGDGFLSGNSGGGIAWRIADGALTPLNGPLYPDDVQHVQISDRAILWESWGSQVRIAAWTEEAPAAVIREVGEGDIRGLATDGPTLAWLEGTGYDTSILRYAQVALWTGTFGGGELRDVRRVRDVPVHSSGVLGDGVYATVELDDVHPESGLGIFVFYRLSDGARATFRPPDGSTADDVLAVAASDSLLLSGLTYYRVDPRTLDFEAR